MAVSNLHTKYILLCIFILIQNPPKLPSNKHSRIRWLLIQNGTKDEKEKK